MHFPENEQTTLLYSLWKLKRKERKRVESTIFSKERPLEFPA
jgi:hypothetical protein